MFAWAGGGIERAGSAHEDFVNDDPTSSWGVATTSTLYRKMDISKLSDI